MARSRRESHHSDGITDQKTCNRLLQQNLPKADILRCSKERRSSITSSARTINDRGTLGPSGLGGLKPDHQLVRISRKTGTAQLFGSGASPACSQK
jgi:hypothetical protein